ncbi:M23 family metallopeptidase [Enemella evansiae]|uniref:M23 family metallopeptidase n=1 Tax=Enemella evansiae TaxID=2016499 RepID=UPI00105D5941|nr:M23 family metallopeptidase [Enemella evansiae]TDO93548.1 murein DD-endopeptidase MepM/ murein hydrolase activator NlpD [Enemella evansiae]
MTRDLPPAFDGGPVDRGTTTARRSRSACARGVRLGISALAVAALGFSTLLPTAYADDPLNDQRDRVNQQITSTSGQVSESSRALSDATARLVQSQQQLTDARNQLADTQRQLGAAKKADEDSAKRLSQAQDELEKAKAAVAEGQRNVDAQQVEVGQVARTQYQQRTGLVGIGMLVSGEDTGDVSNRVQWSTTVFDSTQAEMDKLKEIQTQLTAAKDKQDGIEKQMAQERAAAAANLSQITQLESTARQQEQAVAALVTSNGEAETAARNQLAADQQQLEGLNAERAQVEQRIAERIAQQKAEEARRAEEARKAREAAAAKARADAAAAKARADAAAAQAKSAPKAAAAPKAGAAAAPVQNATAQTAGSGFIYPTDTTITSAFGMRLHPITKIYKLHDGTDFAAQCNAPLRAPADGVVTEKYFNSAYGNRLMIDHGKVGGKFVTTGYNHANSYTVSVGQRVTKGQIIGYAGTTGLSTGCHLHLMTWMDGELSNPGVLFN